jgi:hypothetical protein
VKLGRNATDTCAVLSRTYGREAMKKSEWHKQFEECYENMEDDENNA